MRFVRTTLSAEQAAYGVAAFTARAPARFPLGHSIGAENFHRDSLDSRTKANKEYIAKLLN